MNSRSVGSGAGSGDGRTPRPRIGLFTFSFLATEGGQGRNFSELHDRLRERRDFELLAFSPHRLPISSHVPTLAFLGRAAVSQLLFSVLLNLVLGRLVKRHRLDLVVLNGGPGGVLLAFRPTAPVIFYANHTYAAQAELVGAQRWKRWLVSLERRGYASARALLAISSATGRELTRRYGVDAEKVRVVTGGVDVERFRPLGLDRIHASVLFVGRLDRRKGFSFLLRAFRRVRDELSSARLFVVGAVGRIDRRLARFLTRHELREHVVFLGGLGDQELCEWMNRCEIQVVPSVFEGLGLAAVEGLASGGLVIGTRGSGLDEVISDGQDGFLVRYGDDEKLAARMKAIFKAPKCFESIRRRARDKAESKFAWERIARQYVEVFEEELAGARPTEP